jgi:NAD-dependent deacetylase
MPDEVWSWYLYRRGVCRAAQPNPAHRACVEIEAALGDGMCLVTQNVDGLHLRAGSSPERTYQIHGNIDFMRCARPCAAGMWPIPEGVDVAWERGQPLGDDERALLRCPRCGGPARPHVLFFDEFYDEEHFRADSALHAALTAELLLIVGTTGGTNVPVQIAMLMRQRDKPLIVVGPEPSRFSEMVERGGRGAFLQGTAGAVMPALARAIGYAG